MNNPMVEKINRLLKEKGIKKAQFYKDCGITSSAYSQWNTGGTQPKLSSLERIADYLGVSVSYLTSENKKPATQSDGSELVNKDEELTELLQRARDDPHIRMLFSVTKDATPEDVERAIKIIQMLKGE